jgi:hypothetical protein
MDNIFSFVILGVFIGFELLNYRRIEKLMNRIMAKDYAEFKYYEDKWKPDIKELKEVREETRELREKEELNLEKYDESDFYKNLEEDWTDMETAGKESK